MNFRSRAALVLAALLGLVPAVLAQGGVDIVPFFLGPLDPAQSALGGLHAARAGQASSIFANPAALSDASGEFLMAHTELEAGLRLEALSFAVPVQSTGGTVALSASYASLAGAQARDESGNSIGDLGFSAMMLKLAYAHPLSRQVFLGAGAELLRQNVAQEGGGGVGFSVGLLARTRAADLGASVDHLGSALTSGGSRFPSPRTLRAGIRAHAAPGVDLLADWNKGRFGPHSGSAGLEWRAAPWMTLRAGYHRDLGGVAPASGFGAGMGMEHSRWAADYGLSADQGAPLAHRLGLRWFWGAPRLQK